MKVLVPIEITAARLISSTVAEPATGEVVWSATPNYPAGTVVISTTTHRRYKAAVANQNRNPVTDTVTPAVWVDDGPTTRWAPFDNVVSTAATAEGTMTIVLKPGFFTSIALFGLQGGNLKITVQSSTGGPVIYSYDRPLNLKTSAGWFDYYFGGVKPQTDFVADGIEPYNGAVLTITITGPGTVKLGTVAIGRLRKLGETQYGAKSKLMDYSRITTDEYGQTKIVRRRMARDISATMWVDLIDAPSVEDTLDDLRGVPAAWIATDLPLYKGLRTFGLGSGQVSYDHPTACFLTLEIKGLT